MHPGPALRAPVLVAALVLAACFESEEERALDAYRSHDYAEARGLSERLADDRNPRGHELLALMAAQGLGEPVDLARAMDQIDRAVALDASYRASREALVALNAARWADAQAAFDDGAFERAGALAAPLAAWGHDGARALTARLVLGQYVAMPGSDMAWRAFFARCSGNTRSEGGARPNAAFAADCLGRAVVWDGTVAGSRGATLLVRMEPGRARARHDLALALADSGAADGIGPGAKIRFRGVIEAQGDGAHPDRLSAVAVLGPAPLSPEEAARAEARERQSVIQHCRKLIDRDFRAAHAPPWTKALNERLTDKERRRQRFYTFIAIASPPEAFVRAANGGWQARIEGQARIQSHNHQIASTSDFVVQCRIDPDHGTRPRTTPPGEVAFEWLSEPRFDN